MKHKDWVKRSRDDRISYMAIDRKVIRNNLYLQLYRLLVEQYRGVCVEDRIAAVKLVEHKLSELESKA